MQIRRRGADFWAAVRSLVPRPARRVHPQRATDERARHLPAEREHPAVRVVPISRVAFALRRRQQAGGALDPSRVRAERFGVGDDQIDLSHFMR